MYDSFNMIFFLSVYLVNNISLSWLSDIFYYILLSLMFPNFLYYTLRNNLFNKLCSTFYTDL